MYFALRHELPPVNRTEYDFSSDFNTTLRQIFGQKTLVVLVLHETHAVATH